MMGGFVVADNPFDSVELMLTFPVTAEALPCYLSLADTLDAGLCKPGAASAEATKAEFLETLPPDAEEPAEVALHVRLCRSTLSAQLERVLAFLRLQQLCKGGVAPKLQELADSDADPSSRSQALKSLHAILVSMQQQYPQSLKELDQPEAAIAELEQQAKDGDLRSRRKAMALRVVFGELAIYKEALEILQKRLEGK